MIIELISSFISLISTQSPAFSAVEAKKSGFVWIPLEGYLHLYYNGDKIGFCSFTEKVKSGDAVTFVINLEKESFSRSFIFFEEGKLKSDIQNWALEKCTL
jgi:hypothetical protein